MISRLVSCFVAGALGATVAVTSPALARGGGGMGFGGMRFGGSRFAGARFVHA